MKSFSPIDVFTGRTAGITEPRRIGCDNQGPTRGHRADQGGLRGHSVGDAYPWRVIGLGDGSWAVHGSDGKEAARFRLQTIFGRHTSSECCHLAHDYARFMKGRYPAGRFING